MAPPTAAAAAARTPRAGSPARGRAFGCVRPWGWALSSRHAVSVMRVLLACVGLVVAVSVAAGCAGSNRTGGVTDAQRRAAAVAFVRAVVVTRDPAAARRLADPTVGQIDGYVDDATRYDYRLVRGPLAGCNVPGPFDPISDSPCWRFRLRGAKIDSADPSSGWGVISVGWLQVAVERRSGKALVSDLSLIVGGKRVRIPPGS